jgi:hypothetical protein
MLLELAIAGAAVAVYLHYKDTISQVIEIAKQKQEETMNKDGRFRM